MSIFAASASHGDPKSHHNSARVIGSAVAGISELIIFHPVDTVAKRLMSNTSAVRQTSMAETASVLNKVIFRDAAEVSSGRKYLSLFPGLGWGAGYKVLQRVYKFGGQPFVKDKLVKNASGVFDRLFGEKNAKAMMHATAGSIIGVGEIVLLPLDVLKIKAQTNPEALKGRGAIEIFTTEGFNLYRGAGWTAARNAPGSFALFGGAAAVKDYVFHLEHFGDATWWQDFVASIAGSMASITVAAPMDVIKTRIQNRPFDSHEPGTVILKRMVQTEGFGAFFKGLIPKLVVVGPKLVFSFTVAQHLISAIDKRLSETAPAPKKQQLTAVAAPAAAAPAEAAAAPQEASFAISEAFAAPEAAAFEPAPAVSEPEIVKEEGPAASTLSVPFGTGNAFPKDAGGVRLVPRGA